MRRPFGTPAKRNLRKITALTVKQLSPQIGEIAGVKRNCFLKNLRIVCRFLRISFFYPCPGISPQRRQAHIFAQPYPIRTVIQFSICPSIGRQREGSFINPLNNQLGTFLPFAQKNFCKLFVNNSFDDKKSRYTAHQISGRKSLAISLMKLCTGSEIQKPSVSAFSAPQADSATGAAQSQSLSAAALCFISDIQLWTLL